MPTTLQTAFELKLFVSPPDNYYNNMHVIIMSYTDYCQVLFGYKESFKYYYLFVLAIDIVSYYKSN